jgi:hypothetical protein
MEHRYLCNEFLVRYWTDIVDTFANVINNFTATSVDLTRSTDGNQTVLGLDCVGRLPFSIYLIAHKSNWKLRRRYEWAQLCSSVTIFIWRNLALFHGRI